MKNKVRSDFESKKQTIGYWEGVLSIIINVVLFGLKYWVGIVTGSVAIIADAWHTLSDSLTSSVVLIGFKISAKPADDDHPFGHGRAEIIASIIIGTLLAIVGFNFLIESIHRFIDRQEVSYSIEAVIIFIISAIVKEGIAQFSIWGGRKYKSHSLIADGWHHRSDAIASLLIVGGFYLSRYFWWIDSVMGIIVSLLIFAATYSIMKGSISPLLGEKPSSLCKQNLFELAKKTLGHECNIHHIHCHNYGDHSELTCHIRLPGDLTLSQAHELSDRLEKAIREDMNIEATIHVEPEKGKGNNSEK